MTLWREDPVPQEWRGLWRRVALERADGSGDVASLVLWLQTESLFVDLRIPAGRPATDRFDPCLAAQEGFAGRLTHNGAKARWQRWIDFRPLGVPDEGRLSRDRRMMVEHGLHDAYVEHWWLDAPGDDTEILTVAPTEIVVRAGDHLMLAREHRPQAPEDLTAAVHRSADVAALLNCEVSYARRDADGWRIAASTFPWREGTLIPARELLNGEES